MRENRDYQASKDQLAHINEVLQLLNVIDQDHRFEKSIPVSSPEPHAQRGVLWTEKEPSFFARARAAYGTVAWSDDIDFAPEHLYESSIPYEP